MTIHQNSLMPTVLALVSCCMIDSPLACPIPYTPLWRLIAQSDSIVVAQVISVEAPQTFDPSIPPEEQIYDPMGTAHLQVLERWKGDPSDEILVRVDPASLCAVPPCASEGRTVLAFLFDSIEGWLGPWNGMLDLDARDLAVYEARVREAVSLQDSNASREERLEWLVRCSEEACTRWHGLYELAGASSEDGDDLRPRPHTLLTFDQLERIAEAFVRDPQLDYSFVLLATVLESHPNLEFDRAAVSAVDAQLQSDEPNVPAVAIAVSSTLRRLGDPRAETLFDSLGEEAMDVSRWRAIWTKAKEDLKGHPAIQSE